MSSPSPAEMPWSKRRVALTWMLFFIAWLLLGVIGPGRIGFAVGGCVLALHGVLVLCWRQDMFRYTRYMRRWGWYSPPEALDRFNVWGFGLFALLGGLAFVFSAVLR